MQQRISFTDIGSLFFLCSPTLNQVQLLYTHIAVLPLPEDTVGETSGCLILIKLARQLLDVGFRNFFFLCNS